MCWRTAIGLSRSHGYRSRCYRLLIESRCCWSVRYAADTIKKKRDPTAHGHSPTRRSATSPGHCCPFAGSPGNSKLFFFYYFFLLLFSIISSMYCRTTDSTLCRGYQFAPLHTITWLNGPSIQGARLLRRPHRCPFEIFNKTRVYGRRIRYNYDIAIYRWTYHRGGGGGGVETTISSFTNRRRRLLWILSIDDVTDGRMDDHNSIAEGSNLSQSITVLSVK